MRIARRHAIQRPRPRHLRHVDRPLRLARTLGGSAPPASNPELIERIAPRPLLLLSAGRSTEARANEEYDRRGGTATELWNLPNAPHAAALGTDPSGYRRHVIGFLDRTLR